MNGEKKAFFRIIIKTNTTIIFYLYAFIRSFSTVSLIRLMA